MHIRNCSARHLQTYVQVSIESIFNRAFNLNEINWVGYNNAESDNDFHDVEFFLFKRDEYYIMHSIKCIDVIYELYS